MANNEFNVNGEVFEPRTIDAIGKFAILWSKFENDWCGNFCSNNKIKQVADSCVSEKWCGFITEWQEFAAALKSRAIYCGYEDCEMYVDNMGALEYFGEEPRSAVKGFLKKQEQGTFAGGLMAIYRIRNNMFHGLKGSLNEQFAFFEAVNKLLEKIIKKD